MADEDSKLAKSAFVTCELHTLTEDDIKLPTEADADYFRKLPNEPNPIALGWRCVCHPPATSEAMQAVSEIKTLSDVSMGSWWLDDRGFIHFLVWATKKDKDGNLECRPNALRRPAKPILQTLFSIKPNQATHQSARRDEIRACGGFEVDPSTGSVIPLAPSQLLVPQPPPSAADPSVMDEHFERASAVVKKSENSIGHLGLPPAPRIAPTPKQAASNPPAATAVANKCKMAIHEFVEAEAQRFSTLFARLLAKVQNKQPVTGLAKTKGLRDEKLQVLDKSQLILPFNTATVRLPRFAMTLACSIPVVKLSSHDGNFLLRPDAELLLDLWPRYTANGAAPARKIVRGDRPESGIIESSSAATSLDPAPPSTPVAKPPPPQESSMSKSSSKASALPNVSNKNKPSPPAAAAAASSSTISEGDDFMTALAREIPSDKLKGNFYYEGGRCFADRALHKKAVHQKLIGLAKDAIGSTGMFDPKSDVMKSAADVRASQLPSRSADWETTVENAFMLFSMVPALLAVRGFLDNGVGSQTEALLSQLRAEAAEMGKERAKLAAELNSAKRRNEELEEELEEARKAPKADPLAAAADI